MANSRVDLLQGTLDMLILQTLNEGKKHGYAIVRHIQSVTNEVLSVEEGSLYPALHRMEGKGWIVSEWGLSENNRRAKYYQLTRSGSKQLEEQVLTWERFAEATAKVLGLSGRGS
ncbi:MAG: PadR family transcriptional regulator [Ignavibacteriae bacterium]|nr:PadR family transcriptional regulator [Ignavibacteriota bacterium]MCB9214304.1 PadR family transcriptional regulator [Ignavibacteria bacterium]